MTGDTNPVDKDRRRVNWAVLGSVISLVVTFLMQLAATVWFAGTYTSTTSVKLDMVLNRLSAIEARWYTQDDARRDLERLGQRDNEFERRVTDLERRLNGYAK